jgi:predicted enzyme related to lactoylglutathione lyase
MKTKKPAKKVTGLGGIFFKCHDPEKMKKWYAKNLGIVQTDKHGSVFEFKRAEKPHTTGYTVWSPFSKKSQYFGGEWMVNYRVENIEALVKELKKAKVKVVDKIEEFEYGKFVHIIDPEGNKIELWEPVDEVFTKIYKGKTTK